MGRKRVNKNLVAGVTIFVFLCAIGASVLALRQLQQVDPQHFVTLADRYAADEQWLQAGLFYRKAYELSQNPGHLVTYGDMLLNSGEVVGALQFWGEALIKQPDLLIAHRRRVDLVLEIARLYGKVDYWSSVQEAAEQMLKLGTALPDADGARAHHAYGMALMNLTAVGNANPDKGLADLQEAVKLAPEVIEYAIDLAVRHIQGGERDMGERILVQLREKYPSPGADGSRVRLALSRYLGYPGTFPDEQSADAAKRFAAAQEIFHESVLLAANDPTALYDARLGYSMYLFQKRERALADPALATTAPEILRELEQVLQDAISGDPERFDGAVQLADVYLATRRYSEVITVSESRLKRGFSRKGVEASRDKWKAFFLMILASQASLAQGIETAAAGDRESGDSWIARAQKFANDANGEYPGHPRVLSQLGRIKLAQGKDRAALDDLRKAEEAYRSYNITDWENKIILARVHLKLDEPGAAKTVIEEVIGSARGPAAVPYWLLYAQILFQNNELDSPALADVLARIFLEDPHHADARQLQAAIFERKNQTELAIPLIDSPSTVALIRAREAALEGEWDGAINVLLNALKIDPAEIRLVSLTVQFLLERGRAAEAPAVVERALKVSPDNIHLKRIAVAARQDLNDEERLRAVRALIEAEEDPFQRAWYLVDFCLRTRDIRQALTHLNDAEQHLLLKDTPATQTFSGAQHRVLLRMKLQLAAQLNDEQAMKDARDAAAKYDVDGAGGKSVLGLYHMYREEWDAASLALRAAVEAQPTHTRSLTALAFCLHKLGDKNGAQETYERALRVNPSEALAHKGLAMVARDKGDRQAYENHLAACKRLMPGDPWVREEVLAREEQADPAGAIRRREAALAADPQNVANLRRLAALYEAEKDFSKADEVILRLQQISPGDSDVVVALAQYYRRTGRPQLALEAVRDFAATRATTEEKADAELLVAAHHLSLRELDQAEKVLLAAAAKAETLEVCNSLAEFYLRSRNRPDQALGWFERAVALARRDRSPKLIGLLSARIGCLLDRGVDDLEKASRYVEEFRKEYPEDLRGLLWASEVHAREGHIDAAIQALSRYLERRPNDAPVLYQRAQHYAAQGRIPAAITDLESIKRTNQLALDLEPRIFLARLHYRIGRGDLGIRELESLAVDAPNAPKAMETLVGAYIRENRFSDADRIVTAQINRVDTQPDPRWFVLRGSVSLALKDPDKAIADFQRAAELSQFSAESIAWMLQLYDRLRRFDEGVRYYEQHLPVNQPSAFVLSRYAGLLARIDRKADAARTFRAAMEIATRGSREEVGAVTADLFAAFPDFTTAIALFETSPAGGPIARANDRILVRFYRVGQRMSDAHAKLARLIDSAATDHEHAELLLEQGELFQHGEEMDRARLAYEEALRYDADNWVVLNNLAYVLSEKLHEPAKALSYAKAAVKAADTADTLDTLGWIQVQVGNYAAAIAELSRALRLNPDSSVAYYHLGEAYRRNQQFTEALAVLQSGAQVARTNKDDRTLQLLEGSRDRADRRNHEP